MMARLSENPGQAAARVLPCRPCNGGVHSHRGGRWWRSALLLIPAIALLAGGCYDADSYAEERVELILDLYYFDDEDEQRIGWAYATVPESHREMVDERLRQKKLVDADARAWRVFGRDLNLATRDLFLINIREGEPETVAAAFSHCPSHVADYAAGSMALCDRLDESGMLDTALHPWAQAVRGQPLRAWRTEAIEALLDLSMAGLKQLPAHGELFRRVAEAAFDLEPVMDEKQDHEWSRPLSQEEARKLGALLAEHRERLLEELRHETEQAPSQAEPREPAESPAPPPQPQTPMGPDVPDGPPPR